MQKASISSRNRIQPILQWFDRFDVKQRFLLFEDVLLFIVPGGIVWSLRKYLPVAFFYLAAGLLAIVIPVGRARGKPIKDVLLAYLLGVTGLAFILGIWEIYDIGAMFCDGDSQQYLTLSKLNFWSMSFWSGEKPMTTALIFKIFQRNLAVLNDVFIGLYLVTAGIFIVAMTQFFPAWREKLLAGYLFLPFFLNQHDMSFWVACALSEVPSITTTLLLIALFGLSYRCRDALARHALIGDIVIVIISGSAFFFAFTRDSNAYYLPVMLLFYWVVLKKFRHKMLLACCLLAIFLGDKIMEKSANRWQWFFYNVFSIRIIPDAETRQVFQQEYHFPTDEAVLACTQGFLVPCKGKAELQAWIDTQGYAAYQHFLITHPRYTIREWVKAWESMQADLWSLAAHPSYYAAVQVRPKRLNALIFNFPGTLSLQIAILLVLLGILFIKRNPVILFCLSHSALVGILSFHGDAEEVARHAQQPMMALKIAFLLGVLHIYTIIKTHYCQNRIFS